MAEYASKGVANAGLTTGIIGTSLAGLMALGNGNGNGGGLLSGILGNGNNNQVAALLAENAQLKGENYADKVGKEVYAQSLTDNQHLSDRLFDKYIGPMAQEIAGSREREARMEEQIKCLGKQMELREQIVLGKVNEVALVANNGLTALNGQLACLQNTVNNITKVVVPNSAICPGWGDVTITPATTTAAAA